MSPGTLLRNIRPDDGTGQAGRQGSAGEHRHHTRYGLLLAVLMISYVLSAFIQEKWFAGVQIALFLVVSLLAFRAENFKRRAARWVAGVAIVGSIVAVVLALNHSDLDSGLAYAWSAFMLLFAVGVIVRRVLAQPEVSLQSIFGAVSAYIIIGLMFAAIYEAINQFTPAHAFFVQTSTPTLKTFQYFSFTTLTTLGYGDYTSAQSGGQAIAVMEALLGQIFLATLVARLVAGFRRTSLSHQGRFAAQASEAQPPSPGDDSAPGGSASRVSPRARARQARRSRLRPG
jgi:voltage-gated potassium channel Kch